MINLYHLGPAVLKTSVSMLPPSGQMQQQDWFRGGVLQEGILRQVLKLGLMLVLTQKTQIQ